MNSLKIIIFGLGTGEALLCELDDGNWLAIDSFLEPTTKEPIALNYLKNLGVDPEKKLTKVILTHFHEDHILGSKDLIAAASPNVKVYVPQAMTLNEMKKFYGEQRLFTGYQPDNKLEAFMSVIKYLFDKGVKIMQIKEDSAVHAGNDMHIHALSPSDHDAQASLHKFLTFIGGITERSRLSVSKHHPNSFSVSLHVNYNKIQKSALLSGDLETCASPNGGWIAAMSAETAPKKTVDLIKVSHHGSETGYHKAFWDNFITNNSHAVITTNDSVRGGGLPQESMIETFSSHTQNLSCTTTPNYIKQDPSKLIYRQLKKKHGHQLADKMVKMMGNKIANVAEHKYGFVIAEFDNVQGTFNISRQLNAITL
ncbi:MBL fold metallo-hydrolase [Vibrio fluvialis]|nr:MBL fold metallo-hydrolase [Vibrio fluvialis]ELP3312243.1 MBL fold metallo-hydrolase [Vibrio fluvialis]